MKRWVQEAVRCTRGGGEGESGEKHEAEDMEEEPLEDRQESTMQDVDVNEVFRFIAIAQLLQGLYSFLHQGMGHDQVISLTDQHQPRGKQAKRQTIIAPKTVDQTNWGGQCEI